MGWSTTRPLYPLIDSHHANIDRMIAQHFSATFLNRNINSCHAVILLLFCREFQIVVQALDTTEKIRAIMLCWIKPFYA